MCVLFNAVIGQQTASPSKPTKGGGGALVILHADWNTVKNLLLRVLLLVRLVQWLRLLTLMLQLGFNFQQKLQFSD